MSTEPVKGTTGDQPPPYQPVQQPGVAYPPPQQNVGMTTTTVVAQPTTVMLPMVYGANPMNLTCPHCQAQIVTATDYEAGTLTWLLCCGTALVGCWMGCCLIPFCITDVQDCRHTCPNCKNVLGVYRRI